MHTTPDLRLTEEAFPTGGTAIEEPEVMDESEIIEGDVLAEGVDEPAATAEESEETSDESEEDSAEADDAEVSEDVEALAEARASSDDADQSA